MLNSTDISVLFFIFYDLNHNKINIFIEKLVFEYIFNEKNIYSKYFRKIKKYSNKFIKKILIKLSYIYELIKLFLSKVLRVWIKKQDFKFLFMNFLLIKI